MTHDRRTIIGWAATALGSLSLGGCNDTIGEVPKVVSVLDQAEKLTQTVQRALIGPAMAREFSESDISKSFKPNGSTEVDDESWQELSADGFAKWRLKVDGLVAKPLELSLQQLREMPSRTQVTRHDCVEGWSCIGKWKGVPLNAVLDQAELKPEAKFIVFHCADTMGSSLSGPVYYYESVGLEDAAHPQTILAYEMNNAILPGPHGAPLRLRVERQLGYKHAKYIKRIEAVAELSKIGGGSGGYWEDQGYEWYAGI